LLLCGTFEGPFDAARKFDWNEVFLWKEIIFAGFVDYAQEAFRPCIIVAKRLIDFPELKGHFIAFISNTNHGLRI
jgi:hypothetical protein